MAIANRFSSQEAGQEDKKITYVHARLSITCNAHNIQTPSAGAGRPQVVHRAEHSAVTGVTHGGSQATGEPREHDLKGSSRRKPHTAQCSAATRAQAPAGPRQTGAATDGLEASFHTEKTRVSRRW